MTALDVSALVTNTGDSPELTAFKQKVVAEAKKHSASYHCGEYKSILKKLDIKEEKQVAIKVTTSHPFELTVRVLPSLLNNKSEDEQKEELSKAIGALSLAGSGGSATGFFTVPASAITAMELLDGKAAAAGGVVPEGWEWAYVSDEGRVLHLYRINDRNRYSVSVCGVVTYYQTDTSTRGEARNCERCTRELTAGRVQSRLS